MYLCAVIFSMVNLIILIGVDTNSCSMKPMKKSSKEKNWRIVTFFLVALRNNNWLDGEFMLSYSPPIPIHYSIHYLIA